MKLNLSRKVGLPLLAVVLYVTDPVQLPQSIVSQAEALIGLPFTPLSFAGVARRTARRSVYAVGAMDAGAANAAQQQAAQAEQQANQVESQSILPVGSTLPSLPGGCDSKVVGGDSYFTCDSNWFRPAMQGGNIVYKVVAAPS